MVFRPPYHLEDWHIKGNALVLAYATALYLHYLSLRSACLQTQYSARFRTGVSHQKRHKRPRAHLDFAVESGGTRGTVPRKTNMRRRTSVVGWHSRLISFSAG
jgi:hypothetical protein